MPELALALISICIALTGAALTAWPAVCGALDSRPDPLEEAAAAQRAATNRGPRDADWRWMSDNG